MRRFFLIMVAMLMLGAMVVGTFWGCTPEAKQQKLVGVGSFGIREPILKGLFSVYLINPYGAGNIIIDKLLVIKEDGMTAVLELTPEEIDTPKGEDNILEPYESWEFVSERYTEVPPEEKLTFSAWVYWRPEEGYENNQLSGWWYQKMIFTPVEGEPPQLCLLQYPMVNTIE